MAAKCSNSIKVLFLSCCGWGGGGVEAPLCWKTCDDACAKDMGNIIKHTNYANTGTQFTIQDASNFKCSTFKKVSAKLQSWMYNNDAYFQYNAETTCECCASEGAAVSDLQS